MAYGVYAGVDADEATCCRPILDRSQSQPETEQLLTRYVAVLARPDGQAVNYEDIGDLAQASRAGQP